MGEEGLLLVISGPSGAGKGTICKEIMSKHPHISYSVSATTREPRKGEVDGVNYHFLSKERFEEMLQRGDFLEWAKVYDNYYGTPKEKVMKYLKEGEDIVLEIDIQGALQIKQDFPDGIFIFIVPPSLEELKERIVNRGTDSEEVIKKRLSSVHEELGYVDKYDYVILNDDVENAAKKMESIILAEKCRPCRTKKLLGGDSYD